MSYPYTKNDTHSNPNAFKRFIKFMFTSTLQTFYIYMYNFIHKPFTFMYMYTHIYMYDLNISCLVVSILFGERLLFISERKNGKNWSKLYNTTIWSWPLTPEITKIRWASIRKVCFGETIFFSYQKAKYLKKCSKNTQNLTILVIDLDFSPQ